MGAANILDMKDHGNESDHGGRAKSGLPEDRNPGGGRGLSVSLVHILATDDAATTLAVAARGYGRPEGRRTEDRDRPGPCMTMLTLTPKRSLPISAHTLRELAVSAPADPRTIRRLLLGKPTAAMARARIEAALRNAGLAGLIPGAAKSGVR